jgi:hypothetical protein
MERVRLKLEAGLPNPKRDLGLRAIDMHDIPIWLPPLPLATVALVLFVLGILAWFRGRGRQ